MWFDQNRELLGSLLRITFEHSDTQEGELLLEKCWQRIENFHQKYSRFINDNTLFQINSQLNKWQTIDEETYKLLKITESFQKKYALNFSLAVKTTLENLGYDQTYSFQPKEKSFSPAQIKIELQEPHQLFISAPIEFGGFGKGHALDLAVGIISPFCQNICLDFGGDLYARGKNPSGDNWKIALESPFNLDEAIGIIPLNGNFLTASNTLKRKWGKNKKFHHLIDVKNNRPADYWAGSYILADSGMLADYLATALFCTSPEDLKKNSEALSECQFMLIDNNKKIFQHNFEAEIF